jgi:hypothetical protein
LKSFIALGLWQPSEAQPRLRNTGITCWAKNSLPGSPPNSSVPTCVAQSRIAVYDASPRSKCTPPVCAMPPDCGDSGRRRISESATGSATNDQTWRKLNAFCSSPIPQVM